MTNSKRDRLRTTSVFRANSRASLVATCLLLFSGACQAEDAWSKSDIAALFPPAMTGWSAGEVEIEPINTPLHELELFAKAFSQNYENGVSIRLKAVRTFASDDRKVRVTIDTSDIESSIHIDAMHTVLESRAGVWKEFTQAGYSKIHHDDLTGFRLVSDSVSGQSFRIGSDGIVVIECWRRGCEDDLDSFTIGIDFSAVAEFIEFDHRSTSLPE